MTVKSNCYKCENRYVGCHSKCEKYKEYRKALDVINIRRKEIKDNDRLMRRCKYGKSI